MSSNLEKAVLRDSLRWVMVEFLDASESHGGGSRIPAHLCEFDTNPEKGACTFHEEWFQAAAVAGLLDDWAADEMLEGIDPQEVNAGDQ